MGFWPVLGEGYEEYACLPFFFRNAGTESMCPGTRVPALGCWNTRVVDLHQNSGQSFVLYLPAEKEPVISPCSSTAGRELTKIIRPEYAQSLYI